MPHLKILREFSYKQGKEILLTKHPDCWVQIKEAITSTALKTKSKKSLEKTKVGKIVWSGKDFLPLKTWLRLSGWQKKKVMLSEENCIVIDFFKNRVAVSPQFGKYFAVDTDFVKFEILYHRRELDVGVEIVPTKILKAEMYTGPSDFDQVTTRLMARGGYSPVPIYILGVGVFG
jgi:hypothetical protein